MMHCAWRGAGRGLRSTGLHGNAELMGIRRRKRRPDLNVELRRQLFFPPASRVII